MISEILKLTPQIDRARLEQMMKTLSERFKTLARKFGDGLKFTAKIGGPLAILGGFLTKLLNPLERAEEIIDRMTGKAGDISDTATDLETTPGKLFRMQSLAEAKGVDADTLRMLLGKFQTALAEERQRAELPIGHPDNKPGALREFISEKDTAEAFFTFMQSMRELPKDMQVLVQNSIFGERVRGRAVPFLNMPAEEIRSVQKQLPSVDALSQAVDKVDAIGDMKDMKTAISHAQDFLNKSALMNNNMPAQLDKILHAREELDNDALRRFGPASGLELEMLKSQRKLESLMTDLMVNVMPTALKFIQQGFEAIETYGKFFMDELWPGIKQAASDFTDMLTTFKNDVSAMFDKAMQSVTSAIDGFTAGIRGVWDKVGAVQDSITSFFTKTRGRNP